MDWAYSCRVHKRGFSCQESGRLNLSFSVEELLRTHVYYTYAMTLNSTCSIMYQAERLQQSRDVPDKLSGRFAARLESPSRAAFSKCAKVRTLNESHADAPGVCLGG